jgi:hypothetical protein
MNRCATLLFLIAASQSIFEPASAQIANDFVVTANHPVSFDSMVYRFNDRLEMLSETNIDGEGDGSMGGTPASSIDGQGTRAFPWNPLAFKKIVQIDRNGALLPSIVLGHNPMTVTTSRTGMRFAMTRIPLQTAGPVYGATSTGVVWSSWEASYAVNAFSTTATLSAMDSNGILWLVGLDSGPCSCQLSGVGQVAAIEPLTGKVIRTIHVPTAVLQTSIVAIHHSLDGSMWFTLHWPSGQRSLLHMDNQGALLMEAPLEGGALGFMSQAKVLRNEYHLSKTPYTLAGNYGRRLVKARLSDAGTEEVFEFPAVIHGFDVRGDGEVVYVFTNGFDFPNHRLHRLNLRTRAMSYLSLSDMMQPGTQDIPDGDLTGYVFANVTDRGGDNDGDGIANGAEVDARSNPFDFESRPDGPRVGVTFAPSTNSLRLNLEDADGLLHPTKGIDVSTLSVTASGIGEIFPLLLPFVSSAVVAADGKSADLEFGLLQIPSNLKIRIEASVRDKTGARGSDWQATPPGNLN